MISEDFSLNSVLMNIEENMCLTYDQNAVESE